MKKYLSAIAILALFVGFACTPEYEKREEENGGTQNNPNELIITGDAQDIKDHSANLTGYANLPIELGDSEVGIIYDTRQSFEDVKKIIATGLDGNNKFMVTATELLSSTTYYYKSFVQNGMAIKYGSVKSFTTKGQLVTSISLDRTSLWIELGHESTLYVTSILPDNAKDKNYFWSSSDNSIASVDNNGKVTAKAKGNTTIKATANDGSDIFASCSVEVYTIAVPQAVDMGIVVNEKNIKWASFNLGASSPEEYGFYYAWGETEPKYDYSWSTYKFGTSQDGPFSRYGTVDNKTEFKDYDYKDDAARRKLGGKWRMPTDEEWTALRTQCTWEWISNYNGTGVAGRIVTATNGNSLFLPAAGVRSGTSLGSAGSGGSYWSSSLCSSDYPYDAFYVVFVSDRVHRDSAYGRYCGRSVRPVTE